MSSAASSSVSIAGIDKVELLRALWERQITASFFAFNTQVKPPEFDPTKAKQAVTRYIDYFCGRAIKTDLRKDTVDPSQYDRSAGQGAFAKIVSGMKASSQPVCMDATRSNLANGLGVFTAGEREALLALKAAADKQDEKGAQIFRVERMSDEDYTKFKAMKEITGGLTQRGSNSE